MIYLKWIAYTLADLLLAPLWIVGAPVVSLFTRPMPDTNDHSWGGWFGTYDNPPQGDSRWLREGWFPYEVKGFKGYLNRIGWLWRNPGYNFQKRVGLEYKERYSITFDGNENITDKYKIPGYYLAKVVDNNKLVGFEFYIVRPYKTWPDKCFRARLGFKIMTDKFKRLSFAPLVNTVHVWKSYGK
jgi:hypothetical protein